MQVSRCAWLALPRLYLNVDASCDRKYRKLHLPQLQALTAKLSPVDGETSSGGEGGGGDGTLGGGGDGKVD